MSTSRQTYFFHYFLSQSTSQRSCDSCSFIFLLELIEAFPVNDIATVLSPKYSPYLDYIGNNSTVAIQKKLHSYFIEFYPDVNRINNILIDIRRRSLSTIIVLLDQETTNLFINVAQRSKLNDLDQLWLTFEGDRSVTRMIGLNVLNVQNVSSHRRHRPSTDCFQRVNPILQTNMMDFLDRY